MRSEVGSSEIWPAEACLDVAAASTYSYGGRLFGPKLRPTDAADAAETGDSVAAALAALDGWYAAMTGSLGTGATHVERLLAVPDEALAGTGRAVIIGTPLRFDPVLTGAGRDGMRLTKLPHTALARALGSSIAMA